MYKKIEKVKLQIENNEIEIDFVKPGFQQIGNIFKFYTEAFKDQLLSKTEQSKLTDQMIMNKCMEAMTKLTNVEEIIAISLTNPICITHIQKCIKECFPNLINIESLQDQVFFQLIIIILNSLDELNVTV